MAYTIVEARANIRAVFQNLGERAVLDETLDVAIASGLRRLSYDRPAVTEVTLAAPVQTDYPLSTLTGWTDGFSSIREVRVAPVTGRIYDPAVLDPRDYRVVGNRLYIGDPSSPSGLVVEFTVPWTIAGVDGASSTTLAQHLESAHLWISCHFLALAMAAKMAGTTDRQLQADFINFRTRSDDYRAIAKEYEENYRSELGFYGKAAAPVISSSPAYRYSSSSQYPVRRQVRI
jgi:hypothetical protein